jgi:hypothetical protein
MSELSSAISQNNRYFSRLIHMIPSDLYQHTESLTGFKNDDASASQENDEDNEGKFYRHKKLPMTAEEKKKLRKDRKKRKYEATHSEVLFNVSIYQFNFD